MSDQNSAFPFEELGQDEGLDIAKIFGEASTPAANPFAMPAQQQVTSTAPVQQIPAAPAPQPSIPQAPVMPAQQTVMQQAIPTQPVGMDNQPVPMQPSAVPPAPVVQQVPVPPAPVSAVPPATPVAATPAMPAEPAAMPESGDLIGAAFAQQEAKVEAAAAKSLFEKAPVFSYGSAKEDITDSGKTFEELRIEKSEDFPELAEGKRVSWSVEYGKVNKAITDPKGTTIRSVKEEIEKSKAFLDGLKKAKDKNPDCLVKPRVTAQNKGIQSYKGVFTSLEEARASGKAICVIPSDDGKIYEMRNTEMGEFVAPKSKVIEFDAIRAGFTPALPLIPLQQIISFFRCYMREGSEYEALALILWDREIGEFMVHIPRQEVSKARISADLNACTLPEDRYLHYCDIHSHNSMAAKFSPVDDADEYATRLYIVLGRLDQFFPDISVRMCCGGTYVPLDPGLVIEGLGMVFPEAWKDNIKVLNDGKRWIRSFCESAENPSRGDRDFWGEAL